MWTAVPKMYGDYPSNRFWLVKDSVTGETLKQAKRSTDGGRRDLQFLSKKAAETRARRMNKENHSVPKKETPAVPVEAPSPIQFFVPNAGRERPLKDPHISPIPKRASYALTIPGWMLETMNVASGDRLEVGYGHGVIAIRPGQNGWKLIKPAPGAVTGRLVVAAKHFTRAGLGPVLGRINLEVKVSADGVGFELRIPLGGK